jgi:hypothetical protein
MRIREIEFDNTRSLDPGAGDLSLAILEAFGYLDPDAMRLLGHRIADRLRCRLQDARYRNARRTAVEIESEVNRQELGLIHGRDDQAEDVEEGPAIPSQCPRVGRALKSQGQPKAQLQFFIYLPFIRHLSSAMDTSRCSVSSGDMVFAPYAG